MKDLTVKADEGIREDSIDGENHNSRGNSIELREELATDNTEKI